ncbi:tRNA (adenosine(37)-N6)-dimethylallyltransferase MiaA [Salinarimonas soli]|uniref:tRNA dimethylallyltransferase n=1 Tax=Salinarimonas soli TaxID=1638099 RepID=A0A5B2VVI4_9HYPH|nr:tRNA (adenosine(37)-N6)-dimethylallyltransferase MiaA [Salinarimonas soli]KAA2242216.1 tRNA (adenosine(37)-N6)-dimethylallyltransferase MiaA [Salinarimonas soli]
MGHGTDDQGGGRVVLIAGPTASGKSALALRLARETGALVVNADSMQVYRDLRVLSARPTPEEEAQAPHRLYGHVDGAVNYSVARYMEDAARLIGEAGGLPLVFVGGTGLYFRALLEGLSDIPPVPDEVRERVRGEAEGVETPELHARLMRLDPATGGDLRPSDRLRVLRALEVHAATGGSLVAFQGRRIPGPLAGVPTTRLFLSPDREVLRRRIDARFVAMVGQGALDEVAALGARGLDPMLPVMRAHGVPGLLSHLRGETGLEAAIVRGQGDTRRYAKRQFTWFRHQMPGWRWLSPEEVAGLAWRPC